MHFLALTKDENGRPDVPLEESNGNTEVLIYDFIQQICQCCHLIFVELFGVCNMHFEIDMLTQLKCSAQDLLIGGLVWCMHALLLLFIILRDSKRRTL